MNQVFYGMYWPVTHAHLLTMTHWPHCLLCCQLLLNEYRIVCLSVCWLSVAFEQHAASYPFDCAQHVLLESSSWWRQDVVSEIVNTTICWYWRLGSSFRTVGDDTLVMRPSLPLCVTPRPSVPCLWFTRNRRAVETKNVKRWWIYNP